MSPGTFSGTHKVDSMKEKIESVFNALQELDVKPTPNNVSILNGVYEILRGIYQEMGEKENAE
jgi:hypothetical protein